MQEIFELYTMDETVIVEIAADYKKKPNVIRLKQDLLEILVITKDQNEMYEWLIMFQKSCKISK